jgi:hypothetical protein
MQNKSGAISLEHGTPARIPAAPPVVTRTVSTPRPAPRFVIELCQASRPIDPLDVPQLDVFDLYHLYSNGKSAAGEIRHSLRLGYFKEPGNAQAIAVYLAPYFRNPVIVPIDAAEIISSLRSKFLPQKDIGASGVHSTVVLATPAPAPTARCLEVPARPSNRVVEGRSCWSRILDLLRRAPAAT